MRMLKLCECEEEGEEEDNERGQEEEIVEQEIVDVDDIMIR